MQPKMKMLAMLLAFVMVFCLLSPASLASADLDPTNADVAITTESNQDLEPTPTEPEPTEPTLPRDVSPLAFPPPEEEGEPTPGPEAEPSDPTMAAGLEEPPPGDAEPPVAESAGSPLGIEGEPLPTETIIEMITISFDSDGGSLVDPIDIAKGTSFVSWPVSVKPFHTFKG